MDDILNQGTSSTAHALDAALLAVHAGTAIQNLWV